MNRDNLSEECQKHECSCENCNFYPLKHFQKCPLCRSEAFHTYPSKECVNAVTGEEVKKSG